MEKFGPNVIGVEFVCLAQKTYFIRYQRPDGSLFTDSRVRGITLNRKTQEQLTFDSVKEILMTRSEVYTEEPFKIGRNAKSATISSNPSKKLLRPTFNKRIVLDNYSTIPYGFVKPL